MDHGHDRGWTSDAEHEGHAARGCGLSRFRHWRRSGSGSAVRPGCRQTLFQPLTIENLLGANLATTNTVRYAVEGTATSGAAGVAEGGDKPQSTIAISTLDEPVKKIATTLVTSDELMEDVPAVQSFVNSRLSLFIGNEVERQLIRGTASDNEVQGLLVGRSVPIYAGGTAVGTKPCSCSKR